MPNLLVEVLGFDLAPAGRLMSQSVDACVFCGRLMDGEVVFPIGSDSPMHVLCADAFGAEMFSGDGEVRYEHDEAVR